LRARLFRSAVSASSPFGLRDEDGRLTTRNTQLIDIFSKAHRSIPFAVGRLLTQPSSLRTLTFALDERLFKGYLGPSSVTVIRIWGPHTSWSFWKTGQEPSRIELILPYTSFQVSGAKKRSRPITNFLRLWQSNSSDPHVMVPAYSLLHNPEIQQVSLGCWQFVNCRRKFFQANPRFLFD
jgi:hypothetical protein